MDSATLPLIVIAGVFLVFTLIKKLVKLALFAGLVVVGLVIYQALMHK